MADRFSFQDYLLGTAGVDSNGRQGYSLNVSMVGAGGVSAAQVADNADAVPVTATADSQKVASRGYVFNGTNWNRQRGDTVGTYAVNTPTAAAANAIVPVVGVGGSSLVVKASAGNLYSASMVAGATAGFLIAYNAVAAPAGGATLTAGLILGVAPVSANSYATLGGNPIPDRFGVGIVLIFSTSTTTYTVPANLALHMRGAAV